MGSVSSASAKPWNDITLSDFRQVAGMSKGTTAVKSNGALSVKGRTVTLVNTDGQKMSNFATKNALLKALTNAHASTEFMQGVRKELGIGQDGAEVKSAKPLNKRTITKILNAYSKDGFSVKGLTTTRHGDWEVVGGGKTAPKSASAAAAETAPKKVMTKEEAMTERKYMRVPEPKWDEFDVGKIKDGHLNAEQLSYLEMNPSKTNGPVTIKFPNDIAKFSKLINEKSEKLKGKTLATKNLDREGMSKFLLRGDYDFKIGDNAPILQKDIKARQEEGQPDVKKKANEDLLSQLETMFGDDKNLLHAFNDLFEGYMSIPGNHQFEKDAFCLNLDFQKAETKSKTLSLSKNADGSYRVSISVKATGIKQATLWSDLQSAMKTYDVKGHNSLTYDMTFDLAKDSQGLAVLKPVGGQEPTLAFDLRGNTFAEGSFKAG